MCKCTFTWYTIYVLCTVYSYAQLAHERLVCSDNEEYPVPSRGSEALRDLTASPTLQRKRDLVRMSEFEPFIHQRDCACQPCRDVQLQMLYVNLAIGACDLQLFRGRGR